MTTTVHPAWLLGADEPRNAPSVPAGAEYHRVLAGENRRIGRGLLALVLLLAGFVVFPTVIGWALAAIDLQMGNTPPIVGGTDYTPLYHAGSMIALALLAPWSMLIQRWLYGVPGASLHSVTSRFRFGLFGKALVVFGPAWMVVIVLGFLTPGEQAAWSRTELVAIFLATLLLTPLQTTGEEYGVRGLVFRVVGSWARGPRAGLIAGGAGLECAVHCPARRDRSLYHRLVSDPVDRTGPHHMAHRRTGGGCRPPRRTQHLLLHRRSVSPGRPGRPAAGPQRGCGLAVSARARSRRRGDHRDHLVVDPQDGSGAHLDRHVYREPRFRDGAATEGGTQLMTMSPRGRLADLDGA